MFPKVFGANTKYGDISQALMVFSIDPGKQGPLGSPLVCQNHTYTHFEVKMNRTGFATIRGEGFYLRDVIDSHMAVSGDTAAANKIPFEFPHGSINVKASWRELLAAEDASTFYTREAEVLDYKTGSANKRKLGLVGLHIVHKTPLRNQWVWTSFEHANNVPGIVMGAAKFSYNDGTAAPESPSPPPIGTGIPPNEYVSPTPDVKLAALQVIRELNLHPQTVLSNAKFHALLPAPSVWRNYHLILTQWPTQPHAIATSTALEGRPFPVEPTNSPGDLNVANTTMETGFQQTSCIACHETAEGAGFDYVFFPAMHAEQAPGTVSPATSLSLDFVKNVRSKVEEAKTRSQNFSKQRKNR